jgi:hypothetical protein
VRRLWTWIVPAVLTVLGLAVPLRAADVLLPASERFATADDAETPSFQRHVLPLLGPVLIVREGSVSPEVFTGLGDERVIGHDRRDTTARL